MRSDSLRLLTEGFGSFWRRWGTAPWALAPGGNLAPWALAPSGNLAPWALAPNFDYGPLTTGCDYGAEPCGDEGCGDFALLCTIFDSGSIGDSHG